MSNKTHVIAALLGATLIGSAAQAQLNTVKLGITRYDTHSTTTGVVGIGVPPGADASTGDGTTVIGVYERRITPNLGIELVLGVPPKITAQATGTVAFLGEVLSARNAAPTVLLNYHFGAETDALRPYVGAGINYTRFTSIKSKLAPSVQMSDSVGLALQVGADYWFSKQ